MDEEREVPIGERSILSHEPVPGYRGAFYITLAAGMIYLLLSFTGVV
jgi:hypothetical protein